MKILLNWLKKYIDIEHSPQVIAKMLTLAGLEVDGVETLSPCFNHVVVGRVVQVNKHPDADKLCIAHITDGTETYQVVCGATNCREGLKTALAKVGASLPDGEGKTFKVKKSKLRGVESFGMLCSAKELEVGEDDEGIIEFASHLKEGADVAALYADTLFEISLTPNLGHCASLIGVARELSAALQVPVKFPEIVVLEETFLATPHLVKVQVENKEGCPRYACRVIKNVKVAPSPEWLQNFLLRSGFRPINNVVDVTNYVLLEIGHPLHAFDLGRLEGECVTVRSALAGEKITTLDGKERLLTAEDLLISDAAKGVAIAGVMGGANSEVTETTQDVFLESAYFSPKAIRKTSKRLGIQTEASKRFERGTDVNNVLLALDRAAMLIQQISGGQVAKETIDIKDHVFKDKEISCRLSRALSILGIRLGVSEVESIFHRLGMNSQWDGQDTFHVTVPTYRGDINSEIDLIEEIVRIYGFENISKSAPSYQASRLPHAPMYLFEKDIRTRLISEGLQEFLTCDLIGPSNLELIKGSIMSEEATIKVLNPTSLDQSLLRTSLLPGLLQVVKFNFDHQNQDSSGFEIGRIHYKKEEAGKEPSFQEHAMAAIILSGKNVPAFWEKRSQEVDFFDLKGIVENLLDQLGIKNYTFKNENLHTFHSGRQASIYVNQLEIGSLGEIHPSITRRLDLPQRIYFAELSLHDLFQTRQTAKKMTPIPIYPSSERDWTVTLKEEVSMEKVFAIIHSIPQTLLEKVSLLDIYRSEKLGKGLQNVTFRFVYRDKEKTIEAEKVDAEHARIIYESTKALD